MEQIRTVSLHASHLRCILCSRASLGLLIWNAVMVVVVDSFRPARETSSRILVWCQPIRNQVLSSEKRQTQKQQKLHQRINQRATRNRQCNDFAIRVT